MDPQTVEHSVPLWVVLSNAPKESDRYYNALADLVFLKTEQQKLLNFKDGDPTIDRLLDILGSESQLAISRLDRKQRMKVFVLLNRMCRKYRKLPSSLVIETGIEREGLQPWARSSSADVWKARYNGELVVVKVMRSYWSQSGAQADNDRYTEKAMKKFCREAIVWKQLSHPNLVPFLGIEWRSSSVGLVSERMVHGTILQFIHKKPETNRLKLLHDVASGLEYLHGFPLIHSDLKSPNILIDRDFTARICDFGLTDTISALSMSIGSPPTGGAQRWMAPELWNPGQISTKETDIYAFGMVAYEVFTGAVPFPTYSDLQVGKVIYEGGRPGRPKRVEPLGLDDEVWGMIQKCWDSDKEVRPPIKDVRSFFRRRHENWIPLTPEALATLRFDLQKIPSGSFPLDPTCTHLNTEHYNDLWHVLDFLADLDDSNETQD